MACITNEAVDRIVDVLEAAPDFCFACFTPAEARKTVVAHWTKALVGFQDVGNTLRQVSLNFTPSYRRQVSFQGGRLIPDPSLHLVKGALWIGITTKGSRIALCRVIGSLVNQVAIIVSELDLISQGYQPKSASLIKVRPCLP